MKQEIYLLAIALCCSVVTARFAYLILVRYSTVLKLTDLPNHRKVHKTPIPLVGGVGILLTIIAMAFLMPDVRASLTANFAVSVSLFTLGLTGMIDDRMNLSAKLRLMIQLLCSFAVAHSGIRISSLHGFIGIYDIGIIPQYVLTVVVITGITNAINLVDGIDGLAGSLALINITVLAGFSVLFGEKALAVLLTVVAGALIAFLKLNWRPAKLFMGDGGSLFLGFLMSVSGIYLT